ncbi:MAG TPA: prepilin peptidase [Candidatus Saccharimonadales bacterium]|nr:prepilin peptidase [Candidatus Saccharimonadales bacterium]
MILVVLVLLGLALGSFVNALVWRLHEGRSFVAERSECTHCHHKLAPKDLIPVVSWLLLKGKCRYCHRRIEDTPIAELLVPGLMVLSYIVWPVPLHGVGLFEFVLWCGFIVAFVALAIYDVRWYLLPDKLVFPVIGLAVFWVLAGWLAYHQPWQSAVGSLIGAAVIAGIFYALYRLSSGEWIGFGDVKLAIALGLLAGGALHALLILFVASFVGVLVALPLLVAGKANRKSHLPFGPLLLIGMFVVQLWGTSILDAYLHFITP